MARIGGEIEQLSELSASFQREAQEAEGLMRRIRSQLSNTVWEGGAADRFRSTWQDQFEPSLRDLENALVEAGREIDRRRTALIEAGG